MSLEAISAPKDLYQRKELSLHHAVSVVTVYRLCGVSSTQSSWQLSACLTYIGADRPASPLAVPVTWYYNAIMESLVSNTEPVRRRRSSDCASHFRSAKSRYNSLLKVWSWPGWPANPLTQPPDAWRLKCTHNTGLQITWPCCTWTTHAHLTGHQKEFHVITNNGYVTAQDISTGLRSQKAL